MNRTRVSLAATLVALLATGVDVEQKTYDGVAHEFFGMGMVLDKTLDAEKMAGDALKKAFNR